MSIAVVVYFSASLGRHFRILHIFTVFYKRLQIVFVGRW